MPTFNPGLDSVLKGQGNRGVLARQFVPYVKVVPLFNLAAFTSFLNSEAWLHVAISTREPWLLASMPCWEYLEEIWIYSKLAHNFHLGLFEESKNKYKAHSIKMSSKYNRHSLNVCYRREWNWIFVYWVFLYSKAITWEIQVAFMVSDFIPSAQFYNSCKFMTLAREKINTSVIWREN